MSFIIALKLFAQPNLISQFKKTFTSLIVVTLYLYLKKKSLVQSFECTINENKLMYCEYTHLDLLKATHIYR